ncbi:MAG TPA: hypothetical protein VGN34_15775, partial [Ktedonobacteraceae bacterium]
MSTSAWDGPESKADEGYPLALFKNLLKQMMLQFAAQGACLALYDEHMGQMRIQLHVRLRNTSIRNLGSDGIRPRRRLTVHLENDNPSSPLTANARVRPMYPSTEDLDEVSPQQSSQFAVGSTYPIGHELIGFIWQKNEAYVIRHEDYLSVFYKDEKFPESVDVVPNGYLVVPIQEVELSDELSQQSQSNVLGVVVLYQLNPSIGIEFHSRQRTEALFFVERFA